MTADPTSTSNAKILVTGDFLIDHHIYEGKRHHFGDHGSPGVCVTEELGGAALIHRLLKELKKALIAKDILAEADWNSVLAIDESKALEEMNRCRSSDGQCVDQPFASYAFWRPFERKHDGKAEAKDEHRWYVGEQMGFGGGPVDTSDWRWDVAKNLPEEPAVLVISDGGMGFRSRRNCLHWRLPIKDKRLVELANESSAGRKHAKVEMVTLEPSWIVVKMSSPPGEGDLWRELSEYHVERLVVVVSASELRRAEVPLGYGLSWEQTLEDLYAALKSNPSLLALSKSRHLIVVFDNEGAIWIERDENKGRSAQFVYDSEIVEGEKRRSLDGNVYGQLSCMTAMVAAELAATPDSPDLTKAIRRGLTAMRYLRQEGHGDSSKRGAGFPAASLADAAISSPLRQLQVCHFPSIDKNCAIDEGWSILALQSHSTDSKRPLNGIARRVLIRGPLALNAPVLRVRDLITADRKEIESIRSLRHLIHRYIGDRKADKPLSIGVFGAPGSGKSFAVKELAHNFPGKHLSWLEFNLSQFNGPADLIGALHQVRDKILEGSIPVVFFDEFDSQNLVWLKYLLAPMQDGRFQELQISHPVGQCIFAFAGGTSFTFEEFAAKEGRKDKPKNDDEKHFILSKGPDFASRLDGILNVVGPNPRPGSNANAPDIFCPIRRALFIRSRLKCADSERLEIHPGLATALLEIPEFSHGSRSITKLLEPYRTQKRSSSSPPFGFESLPSRDQVALHVKIEVFDQLVHRDEKIANSTDVEKLAVAIHTFYRDKGRTNNTIKPHLDKAFEDLSPFDKASNRAAARRISPNLALAGLKLEKGRATSDERKTAESIILANLELLAEAEHDGWMEWYDINGWTKSSERSDALQEHPLLVPYANLKYEEKQMNSEAIRNYQTIIDDVQLKIVPA